MLRLKLAYNEELNNYQWENERIYEEVETYIKEMIKNLDKLHNLANDKDEIDENKIDLLINKIDNLQFDINSNIETAKENGINNEGELDKGGKLIDDLEEELNQLRDNLDNIEDENDDLKNEIDIINDKISEIKNKLNDDYLANNSRLKKSGKKHAFICYAHDEIMEKCEDIHSLCENFSIKNTDINKFYADVINAIYIIEDDIAEALEMNERMGNGINSKNQKLQELYNEIESINDEIDSKNLDKSELRDQLQEVDNILINLENQLDDI